MAHAISLQSTELRVRSRSRNSTDPEHYLLECSEVRGPRRLGSDSALCVGPAKAVKCSHDANNSCRHMKVETRRIESTGPSSVLPSDSEIYPEEDKKCVCVADRRCEWMSRRRTVEVKPTFYSGQIVHPPDSEADQNEILVANRLVNIDLLLWRLLPEV
jgi:hypothetical protein